MKTQTRTMLGLLVVLGIVAVGGGVWLARFHAPKVTALGVGEPLPVQSHARIDVIEEAKVVPVAPVSASVAVSRGIVIGEATAPEAVRPPLGDVTGLKLGTTLALLTQAYANGGVMARSLANVAEGLVHEEGSRELADAVENLRNATPLEGPMTTLALVNEAQRVERSGAPDGLPETAPPEPESWLMRQISRFVTIRRGEEPSVDSWTRQLRLVEQLLARGNVADAKLTLETSPLSKDARLDVLRQSCGIFLDQQGKLTNAMNAYIRTYLQAGKAEAR